MTRKTYQENLYYLPYHWMMKGYLRVSMEFRNKIVMKYLNYTPGQKILDLGCGDGYFTANLKDRLPEALIVGADYYLRALRFAKIMTDDAPYVAASAVSLSFKKESFDAIFLLDVIEHIDKHDREKALNQAFMVLKPGGVIIITVPSNKLPVISMHYDHFDRDNLKMLMQKHFTEVNIYGCCIYLPIIHKITRFPIIWRIIYFTIRKCKPEKAVTLIGYGIKAD
ncbi:MAG: class I SAM-dependent methyltransferase [Bacteroidetes bacterium]|nr:class I SAM-dependent methyltransferase [Bacteroidota bacterium]